MQLSAEPFRQIERQLNGDLKQRNYVNVARQWVCVLADFRSASLKYMEIRITLHNRKHIQLCEMLRAVLTKKIHISLLAYWLRDVDI